MRDAPATGLAVSLSPHWRITFSGKGRAVRKLVPQDKGESILEVHAQGKLIRKTNIYGASARGQGSSSSRSARDSAVGLLEPGAPRRPAGSGAGGGSSAKASWLSGNKVNIAPDVCPGVEAISSSLPAHFIFQN